MTRVSLTEMYDNKDVIQQICKLKDEKQDTLIAGEGISIVDNVISATGGGGGAVWGQITGTLRDQQDLINELSGKALASDLNGEIAARIGMDNYLEGEIEKKQKRLAAGANITITPGEDADTISATGELAVAWGGIDGNLADQKDLQAALDAKASVGSLNQEVNARVAAVSDLQLTKANASDVYAKSETYSKSEVDLALLEKASAVSVALMKEDLERADAELGDRIDDKQDTLIAGSGITITENIISTTNEAIWGGIVGFIENQNDLMFELSRKQKTIMVGTDNPPETAEEGDIYIRIVG